MEEYSTILGGNQLKYTTHYNLENRFKPPYEPETQRKYFNETQPQYMMGETKLKQTLPYNNQVQFRSPQPQYIQPQYYRSAQASPQQRRFSQTYIPPMSPPHYYEPADYKRREFVVYDRPLIHNYDSPRFLKDNYEQVLLSPLHPPTIVHRHQVPVEYRVIEPEVIPPPTLQHQKYLQEQGFDWNDTRRDFEKKMLVREWEKIIHQNRQDDYIDIPNEMNNEKIENLEEVRKSKTFVNPLTQDSEQPNLKLKSYVDKWVNRAKYSKLAKQQQSALDQDKWQRPESQKHLLESIVDEMMGIKPVQTQKPHLIYLQGNLNKNQTEEENHKCHPKNTIIDLKQSIENHGTNDQEYYHYVPDDQFNRIQSVNYTQRVQNQPQPYSYHNYYQYR